MHLAALEHYLKNDHFGSRTFTETRKWAGKKEEVPNQVTFGGRFLESIMLLTLPKNLSASRSGQVEAGTNRIIWTLRIGLIQTHKFYVIRDIPSLPEGSRK